MAEAATVAARLAVVGQDVANREVKKFNANLETSGKTGQSAGKSLQNAFAGATKAIQGIGIAGALSIGGIVLLGKSFIDTAIQAGASSNAFWQFQDASFELRRTLGELLIKVLSPIVGVLAKFMMAISRAVEAIQPIIWRNWEIVLEGIRSSLGLLDRVFGGLLGTLGLFNIGTKEGGRAGAIFGAIWRSVGTQLAETFGDILKGAIKDVVSIFRSLRTILDVVKPLLMVLFAPLLKMLEPLVKLLGPILSKFDLLGKVAQALVRVFFPIVSVLNLLEFQLRVVAAALVFLRDTSVKVQNALIQAWETFRDFWINTWSIVRDKAVSTWTNILEFLKARWEGFRDFWVRSWEGFRDSWINGWNTVRDKAIAVWDAIKSQAVQRWASIKEVIVGVLNSIIDKINSFINLWNNLTFRVPSVGPLPGFTVPTPDIGLIDRIPALARGGRILSPGLALVGERGPELAALPRGATVAPLGAASGRGNTPIVFQFNAPIYGFLDFENQVAEAVRNIVSGGGFRGVLQ